MKRLLAFALMLASTPAIADVVNLRSGGRLEGSVSEEGERFVIRLESGTVKIPKTDVLSIQRATAPLDEYQARAASAGQDPLAHWNLAVWCELAGLPRCAREELEAVIAIDPNHAAAREKLGYERIDGRWVRGTELLRAKGFVKVDGRWVTKEEVASIEAARKRREEERVAALERARQERLEREAAIAREVAAAETTYRTRYTHPRAARRSYRYASYGYPYGYYGRRYYPYGYDPRGGGYPANPPGGDGRPEGPAGRRPALRR